MNQEDYVLQQFAASKNKLQQQQKAQQDQAEMDVNRRVAAGGLTGGAQSKAIERAQQGIAGQYASGEADLESQKNAQLGQVAAQKQAQEFQTGERLGSQQFAGAEAEKQRQLQKEQFEKSFGLQSDQFQEAKTQFDSQMKYQLSEFNENQKTNLINSVIALNKSDINMDNANNMKQVLARFSQLLGTFKGTGSTGIVPNRGPQSNGGYLI
jgi:hypothetical protein